MCQSTTFHNQKNCTTRPKFKTKPANTSLFWTFQNMSFMRRARMWIIIKHPEPSTLIVTLFHWHQCACQYKRSIICEKARVHNISISKHVKMQCNQQPTHQKHRSTWITISRTSQNLANLINKYIVPIDNVLQCVNNCTTRRKFKTQSAKTSLIWKFS